MAIARYVLAAAVLGAGAAATVSCASAGTARVGNAAPVDAAGIARDAGDAHLADSAVVARHTVMALFGLRDIGGWRATDSMPGSDHVTGHAIDVMIPGWDTAAGAALGWQVAGWAQANAAALSVTYVIWANRIWSATRAGEGWRVYCSPAGCPYGAHPSPTQLHADHVHISVGD